MRLKAALGRTPLNGLALALICAFAAGPLDVWHVSDTYDVACEVAVFAHDADAHRVTTRGGDPTHEADHCLACHWLRSLHTAAPSGSRTAAIPSNSSVVSSRPVIAQHRLHAARIPPRSPPA